MKSYTLEEPLVVIRRARRGGSATLLEAELVDNTGGVTELVPAVLEFLATSLSKHPESAKTTLKKRIKLSEIRLTLVHSSAQVPKERSSKLSG